MSPVNFAESLSIYTTSGSKTTVASLGLSTPSGSYSTVRKWLDEQSSKPPKAPMGELVIAFSNEHIHNKITGYHPRVYVSVITSVLHIGVDPYSTLQGTRENKLGNT